MTESSAQRRSFTPPKGAATTGRAERDAARVRRENRIAALQWTAVVVVVLGAVVAAMLLLGDGTHNVVPVGHSG